MNQWPIATLYPSTYVDGSKSKTGSICLRIWYIIISWIITRWCPVDIVHIKLLTQSVRTYMHSNALFW